MKTNAILEFLDKMPKSIMTLLSAPLALVIGYLDRITGA